MGGFDHPDHGLHGDGIRLDTLENLYLFLIGVLGWFAVGVLWNDRAIMLIHIVALGAMVAGMSAG